MKSLTPPLPSVLPITATTSSAANCPFRIAWSRPEASCTDFNSTFNTSMAMWHSCNRLAQNRGRSAARPRRFSDSAIAKADCAVAATGRGPPAERNGPLERDEKADAFGPQHQVATNGHAARQGISVTNRPPRSTSKMEKAASSPSAIRGNTPTYPWQSCNAAQEAWSAPHRTAAERRPVFAAKPAMPDRLN